MTGCQGLEDMRVCGVSAKGWYETSFGGNKNVVKLDCGDDCITL